MEMENKETRTRPEESARFTTLRDWVAVGFRRRRLILTSFVGLLLGTIVFSRSSGRLVTTNLPCRFSYCRIALIRRLRRG